MSWQSLYKYLIDSEQVFLEIVNPVTTLLNQLFTLYFFCTTDFHQCIREWILLLHFSFAELLSNLLCNASNRFVGEAFEPHVTGLTARLIGQLANVYIHLKVEKLYFNWSWDKHYSELSNYQNLKQGWKEKIIRLIAMNSLSVIWKESVPVT